MSLGIFITVMLVVRQVLEDGFCILPRALFKKAVAKVMTRLILLQ